MKLESGTKNHRCEHQGERKITEYSQIKIPASLLNLLIRFNGEIWRSDYRIIIRVPQLSWINYGTGFMNPTDQHDFEQLAWIQTSQFNPHDLHQAINQSVLYEDVNQCTRTLQEYQAKNIHKKNYIYLIYQTKVYQILEEWVINEGEKAQFSDTHRNIISDVLHMRTPSPEYHPPSPANSNYRSFQEEWENLSTSSSDYDLD